jgi:hypothetical protein
MKTKLKKFRVYAHADDPHCAASLTFKCFSAVISKTKTSLTIDHAYTIENPEGFTELTEVE